MTTTLLKQSISMAEALSVSVTGIIVVMIILALLAVAVVLLSKAIRIVESKAGKKSNDIKLEAVLTPAKAENQKKNNGTPLPETQSAGSLDLYKTDEKTAAVIMAIVSNESGIPLNRLQFNSIKLIEE